MTSHHGSSHEPARRPTITAGNPDDLLASVPVLLGFTPAESVVMLTVGSTGSFHARIDLPRSPTEQGKVIEVLLGPVLAHGVRRVAFVVYAASGTGVRDLVEALVSAFGEHDISVLDALHANGTEWFPALPGVGLDAQGVPYDDRMNPISLQAVVDGHLMFSTREELAASLRGEESSVAAVSSHLVAARPLSQHQIPAEGAWALAAVRRHLSDQTLPDDSDTARLLRALHDLSIRDAVWCLMSPDNARGLVPFWTGVVRTSPVSVLAAPATLLAFAAWLSGRGALAWCALDRSNECDPDYSLAALLARMLDRAVPPSAWVSPAEWISQVGGGMGAAPWSGASPDLA